MITEEQIKKTASKILGEENKDWYLSREPSNHSLYMRRMTVDCSHCQTEHHVVFDLREETVDHNRIRTLKFLAENKK